MPYKLVKNGSKTCVVKESGAAVLGGCHADESKAKAHMRALYAAEGESKKELNETEMELVSKELGEKCNDSWVPSGVVSFKDLDAWRETQEETEDIRNTASDFQSLTSNILWNADITDKAAAIKSLSNEFAVLLDKGVKDVQTPDTEDKSLPPMKSAGTKIKDFFTNLFDWEIKEIVPELDEVPNNGAMFWKEVDGTWRWFAKYSNNFRDRDRPPEIISAQSHKSFVDKVDKGLAPYPELWLWHRPEYKWGQATWVAYDDAGFALAMGKVDKGFESIAETMSAMDPNSIRVSHGMPKRTIVRDPVDSTVIIEHETLEISPLPASAAANMLTSFFTISKEDSTMAIPKDKRKDLISWGIPEDVLDKLETQNAAQAKEASESGIQSKEAQAAPSPETPATDVPPVTSAPAPVQKDVAPVTPQANAPTAQEIAEAVSGVLNERLTAINQKFEALEAALAKTQEQVKSLSETDEAKIVKATAATPIASLSAMISRSVIGNSETAVDGRSTLAKSGPKEAPASPESYSNLGVMTVSNILAEYDKKSK